MVTRTVEFDTTMTSRRFALLKPEAVAVTVYVPGESVLTANPPSSVVTTSDCWPVPVFVTLTCAPGTPADEGSVTLPTIDPNNTCALACGDNARNRTI